MLYAEISYFHPVMDIHFKEKVYQSFLLIAGSKVKALQLALAELKEAGANETKSTAGDKHETALAMVQIEQENLRKQLSDALVQLDALERATIHGTVAHVAAGSLVKTNRGCFFLSAAIGKTEVDGVKVMAISAQSPLGGQMLGLKTGHSTRVNGIDHIIEVVI